MQVRGELHTTTTAGEPRELSRRRAFGDEHLRNKVKFLWGPLNGGYKNLTFVLLSDRGQRAPAMAKVWTQSVPAKTFEIWSKDSNLFLHINI